jgi:hypothetical protein
MSDNNIDALFSFEDGEHEDWDMDEGTEESENFDWLTDDLLDYVFPKVR